MYSFRELVVCLEARDYDICGRDVITVLFHLAIETPVILAFSRESSNMCRILPQNHTLNSSEQHMVFFSSSAIRYISTQWGIKFTCIKWPLKNRS